MKEMSPFTPGRPADVQYFTGRKREVERLRRAIEAAARGRNENIFITGERAMGKSSLAAIGCYLSRQQHKFIAAHCFLGAARDLPDVCRTALEGVVAQIPESLVEKVAGALGKYVDKIQAGLFGVGLTIGLRSGREAVSDLPLQFLPTLRRIFQEVRNENKGLLIVLDDINGVARSPEFALFLKSFVDEMATSPQGPLPLLLILVGVEERMADLESHQPSLPRIFGQVRLDPMTDQECREFYERTFGGEGITLQPDALEVLVRFSGGIPAFLHEIGDATYWEDQDNLVDHDDALRGLVAAVDNIGEKYLDRQVYHAIRSETYQSILYRLARHPGGVVKRAEILKGMSDDQRKRLDNFLHRMRKLSFLVPGPVAGTYQFPNELYRVYFMLYAARPRRARHARGSNGSASEQAPRTGA